MTDIDLKKSFKNFINSNENKRFINEAFKDVLNIFGVQRIVSHAAKYLKEKEN